MEGSHRHRRPPASCSQEIKHFFDVYKALEPGKATRTGEFEGRDAAWRVIEEGRAKRTATPVP